MIQDDYDKDRSFGAMFEKVIRVSYNTMMRKDDDYLLLVVGMTGSGKSRLGMHIYSIISETPDISQIALNQSDFSRALVNASKLKGERYLQYDEGKVNRQQWSSKWFQDILGIYHDVRGLHIFHVWCSAYPEWLPKTFIQERVKGMIVIVSKHENKPREFLFFTQRDLLRFMEQNDKLTIGVLRKYGEKHASFKSWFKNYKGPLEDAYKKKKDDRMHSLVNEFFKKWNGETIKPATLAGEVGIDPSTMTTYINRFIEDKTFEMNTHYIVNGAGKVALLPEGADYMRSHCAERISLRLKDLGVISKKRKTASATP